MQPRTCAGYTRIRTDPGEQGGEHDDEQGQPGEDDPETAQAEAIPDPCHEQRQQDVEHEAREETGDLVPHESSGLRPAETVLCLDPLFPHPVEGHGEKG